MIATIKKITKVWPLAMLLTIVAGCQKATPELLTSPSGTWTLEEVVYYDETDVERYVNQGTITFDEGGTGVYQYPDSMPVHFTWEVEPDSWEFHDGESIRFTVTDSVPDSQLKIPLVQAWFNERINGFTDYNIRFFRIFTLTKDYALLSAHLTHGIDGVDLTLTRSD